MLLAAVVMVMYQAALQEKFQNLTLFSVKSCENVSLKYSKL
jgi:hypothetical protein